MNATALNGLNATNFWKLGGNTVTAGQSIGTLNQQPFDLYAGGGRVLRLDANANVIGGSLNTVASGVGNAFIGGGYQNVVSNNYGAVISGFLNTAGSPAFAWSMENQCSTVAGGFYNSAAGPCSFVGSGYGNIASGIGSVVGGGGIVYLGTNYLSANNNQAGGMSATVPGGAGNQAMGDYSFAAGVHAQANHAQTFVWSDGATFTSTGIGQFLVHANGGVGINTNNPATTLDVSGSERILNSIPGKALTVQADDSGSFSDAQQVIIQGNTNNYQQLELGYKTSGNYGSIQAIQQFSGYKPLVLQPAGGNVGIGTTNPGNLLVVGNSGSPAYCNGTSWVNGSDRNSKENFAAINPRMVLEKVSALPITEWKYKVEADGTEHIGPMAQDFHSAFGLNGPDDTHIATVDEAGVALAAIQGLNQKLDEKDALINELSADIKAQQALNEKLKARLDQLERLATTGNKAAQ